MYSCADTKGYAPLTISSHLVRDGVCDCCDGSDEPLEACPDKCAVWAEEAARKKVAQETSLSEGKRRFADYEAAGKAAAAAKMEAKAKAEAELVLRRKAEAEAEAAMREVDAELVSAERLL
jgi:protein kinase C substrate 80K-H